MDDADIINIAANPAKNLADNLGDYPADNLAHNLGDYPANNLAHKLADYAADNSAESTPVASMPLIDISTFLTNSCKPFYDCEYYACLVHPAGIVVLTTEIMLIKNQQIDDHRLKNYSITSIWYPTQ